MIDLLERYGVLRIELLLSQAASYHITQREHHFLKHIYKAVTRTNLTETNELILIMASRTSSSYRGRASGYIHIGITAVTDRVR